ncbi:MAG: lysine 2,3-aminomutase, partial [Kiritimatiellaeota bacterium]|nr:lysine 2,3-aminomutase [Kiritimatiellota bacterium]
LQTGLDIMAHLRGRLSGLGIPHFALDTPDGGKIEMLPATQRRRSKNATLLATSTGHRFRYPDPS